MEWIEVSARTLEDATELALDRLGVVSDELEYEVIEEPRSGLFGIGRTEARIRARVKPLSREKPPDRRRRRSTERRPSGNRKRNQGGGARSDATAKSSAGAGDSTAPATPRGESGTTSTAGSRRRRRGGRGRGGGSGEGNGTGDRQRPEGREQVAEGTVNGDAEDIDVDAQAERAEQFVSELVGAMGLTGRVSSRIDDGTILLAVEGDGLGLLVGPRGSTLQAVEELARAVVQHGLSGRSARLRVDIGGYRERRREALAAFARQVAEEVRASGNERALEPMSPPDRKVVHDTVAELDGVGTSSEGEEPRRRVVIHPG